ncbi:ABC transporter ATP-binding protein [Paenibacillus sp. sgz302251]|uniref:ABC transporter ATP-binding protein n=1 Tax=Paenibacillus sp. sgz302251 TaxID=3414493 RepID=UPI003C7AC877
MKSILYFIGKLHSYAGRILYFNLIAMVLVGFLEGVGLLALIPLLKISGLINFSEGNSIITEGLARLEGLSLSMNLTVIFIVYIMLVVGQTLLQRNLSIRNIRIQTGFIRQLRLETYTALLKADWNFYIKSRKSDHVNVLTSEIARISVGINLLFEFLSSSISTIVQIGIAFWISPNMTLFIISSGLVLAVYARKFIRKARVLGSETSELAQSYLAGITEQMNGIKDIKSNNLEESRLKWFGLITNSMMQEQIEYMRLYTSSQAFYKIMSAVLISAFIFLSIEMFHSQPGYFLLIIVIFARLWPRVTGIQSNIEKISSIIPTFTSLICFHDKCKEAGEEIETNQEVEPIRIVRGIECRNVYFRYNTEQSTYSLQDISIYIPANGMTAIVGRSGAGKSTLVDILMGLIVPERGQTLIDDVPLSSYHYTSIRKSISYVPQEPFMFHSSIRENLLLVKPDATESELWEALEFSASLEFVSRLPEGLDTVIGDRGIRLSGGERQRLVLARAIVRKPSILILDEATSSLDTENEATIQEALDKLKGKITIIVIAHRLSTIRNADQVIVLDRGVVAQTGVFSQLAQQKRGIFRGLLGNQKFVESLHSK